MEIELTDDQKEIIDYLLEQVDNPNGHNVVVSGSGGTGKTTMICKLICDLLEDGYRIAASAMTGKATAVLRTKIMETIAQRSISVLPGTLLIETITKLTKESKVLGLTESGETIYTGVWRSPQEFVKKYDILFIDELSMIPHYISQWWALSNIRVFGFGDECQLPEVYTDESKKEVSSFKHDLKVPEMRYTSGYGIKVLKELAQKQLHVVLRSDNEIALLCGELRNFTLSKDDFIEVITNWAKKTNNIEYSTSMKDIPYENYQIICYTNKLCNKINEKMAIGKDYPDLNDKVILFDNINPLKLYNGDTMSFGALLNSIYNYNKKSPYKIYVCMKWKNKMPNKKSSNMQERRFYDYYAQFKKAIEVSNKQRLKNLSNIIKSSEFAPDQITTWIEQIEQFKTGYPNAGECFTNIISAFQDINLDMAQYIMKKSQPLPRLYMINVDFGYAITTHKSQGSEYKKVCYIIERFDKNLIYTGLSRAKEKLRVINLIDD